MADCPDPPTWDPSSQWHQDEGYLRGCDFFDQRYLWEAHEAWEGVWHQVPDTHPYRLLLQALIQAAAGVLKAHVRHEAGAARLHARSCAKLQSVIDMEESTYRGLDLAELIRRLEAFHAGGAWPTLPGARP
jgi:predicted metal-dependent hydrolase